MDTVYIHSDGALLRRAGRRMVLEKQGELRFCLPLKEIGRVLIYGNAVISAHALETLLVTGVPVYYARRLSFGLRGKVVPATASHVAVRRAQYSICSSPGALDLAKEFVRCKLRNMEAVIFYLLRREEGSAQWRRNVREAQTALDRCRSGEEVMGTEGAAARHYFSLLGGRLPAPFRFNTRSRPATDPVNALLNLGYMTLMREAHTHLEIHDLDPYFGVLHALQDGRPALSLDFMEQFRQPLVDLFVLKLLRRGRLTPEDFQREEGGGIRMTPAGLKTFFDLYRKTMGDLDGKASGLRQAVDSRARALREHFLGRATYRGFELSVSDNIFAGE